MSTDGPLLSLSGISAGYGPRSVLRSIDLDVHPGDVLAVVGHNGAGKTTTLRVITGLKRPRRGRVRFLGHDVGQLSAERRARAGIALVPEGVRGLFATLTVAENLAVARGAGARDRDLEQRLDEAFGEVLVERRNQVAGSMSGGQRQMLALSIALLRRPRVLLLDEPSTGLAPRVVQRIFGLIDDVARRPHTAIVVVEQNLKAALSIATRVCVLQAGEVAVSFPASDCPAPAELWRYF